MARDVRVSQTVSLKQTRTYRICQGRAIQYIQSKQLFIACMCEPQSYTHLGLGLARRDGCHGVLAPRDVESHRSDQTASQGAQCHHSPELGS